MQDKRQRFVTFLYGFGGALTFAVLSRSGPAIAQVSGSVTTFLKLQTTTPGAPQTGHSNITGTSIAGQFVGSGTGLSGVDAAKFGGKTPAEYGPGVLLPFYASKDSYGPSLFRISSWNGTNYSMHAQLGNSDGGSGVYGFTNKDGGAGVVGDGGAAPIGGGGSLGVLGRSSVNGGTGVKGIGGPGGNGVYGEGKWGVVGEGTENSVVGMSQTGVNGVYGRTYRGDGSGVKGESWDAGAGIGGFFQASGAQGTGVYGYTNYGSSSTFGGRFKSDFGTGAMAEGSTTGLWAKSANLALWADGPAKFDGNSVFNGGVRIPAGAQAGHVLTSDANGNATWQAGGGNSGAAGGDLSGTYPNPSVVALQGRSVASTAPTNGQVLQWNGTTWAPATSVFNLPFSGQGTRDNDGVISVDNYSSIGGVGIKGSASAISGNTVGGWFETASTSGRGVFGLASALSGATVGVYDETQSNNPGSYALFGKNTTLNNAGAIGGSQGGAVGFDFGAGTGVFGQTNSGKAIVGEATATSGASFGGYFTNASSDGVAVKGSVTNNIGATTAIIGENLSNDPLSRGVYGRTLYSEGTLGGPLGGASGVSYTNTTGVYGESVDGKAVWGKATGDHASSFGVYGESSSYSGAGVRGVATSDYGINFGGYFTAKNLQGIGLFAENLVGTAISAHSSTGTAVRAEAPSGTAIYGKADSMGAFAGRFENIGTGLSVQSFYGDAIFCSSFGDGRSAVYGSAPSGNGGFFITASGKGAHCEARSGTGLDATATAQTGTTYAIRGEVVSPQGWAGFFTGGLGVTVKGGGGDTVMTLSPGKWFGSDTPNSCTIDIPGTSNLLLWDNVHVNDTLTAGAKNFKIDHPLDPYNKFLLHSCVESDEMKNMYDGSVRTDARGYATVTLPNWFMALNENFRYQLTVVDEQSDGFTLAKISRKIQNGSFQIRTSEPNTEVCWQVTGVRKDAYARANPLNVEVQKSKAMQGRLIHPEAFQATASRP